MNDMAGGGRARASSLATSVLTSLWVSIAGDSALAQSDIDGCALLTAEDITKILGTAVEGEADEFSGYDAACGWQVVSNGMRREVTIEVGRLDASSVKSELAAMREHMTVRQDVDGIGDEAFLAQHGLNGSAIVLRAGTYVVLLSTTVEGKEGTLRAVAPAVLSRLR